MTYVLLGDAPLCGLDPSLPTVRIPLGPASRRLASVCWHSLLLRRKSLQEALLYTPRARQRLLACIARLDPDIVILDTIRIAQFFEAASDTAPRRRWVLYMEDLLSLRYRALARGLDGPVAAAVDPLGAFAPAVPAPLRPLARAASLRALLYRFEASRVARSERRLAEALRNVSLVNGEEVALLARQVPDATVLHTPPCLPAPSMHRADEAHRGPFLIVGTLDYPPNALAAAEFLTQAMPAVVRAMPQARIKIVGKHASATLAALCARWSPHVELVGYVPDLSGLMASAAAMIVPVRIGSGPKLKSLEALAHGLPLISTRNGVEGIDVVPDVHGFVSDDLGAFPAFMQRLREPATNRVFSQRSRALFERAYAADAVHPRYEAAFLGAMQAGQRAAAAAVE
ncbi:glycosyltransferase [Vineibacter terrae]|uniref:glycosyltransferase n=1 Tax=Vineibacter terrae TaxID=2586908 RepID=UPI002E321D60|nr:glycosyltransferase [Vineibacter terrae]HEX2885735.1 glycosyltransferase [Vineibacter terrae]